MSPKHTPGPWVRSNHGTVYCEATGGEIAVVSRLNGHVHRDDCDANCALIAASPELLDALIEMLAESDHFKGLPQNILSQAREAIAKAKGRT